MDLRRKFVVNSACPCGELFGGDRFARLRSEKDDVVAGDGVGDVGDVDHAHVHADASANGGALSADENVTEIRKGSVVAVVVPDGQYGDARFVRRLVGASVANERACGDGFDLRNDSFPGESGTQIDFFTEESSADETFRRRPHAVACDTGSHEFEMRVGPEDAGGGVGDRADGGRKAVLG